MTALLFKDREGRDEYRVEASVDDGAVEIAIFAGPNAHDRAVLYAKTRYGEDWHEVALAPYAARE